VGGLVFFTTQRKKKGLYFLLFLSLYNNIDIDIDIHRERGRHTRRWWRSLVSRVVVVVVVVASPLLFKVVDVLDGHDTHRRTNKHGGGLLLVAWCRRAQPSWIVEAVPVVEHGLDLLEEVVVVAVFKQLPVVGWDDGIGHEEQVVVVVVVEPKHNERPERSSISSPTVVVHGVCVCDNNQEEKEEEEGAKKNGVC